MTDRPRCVQCGEIIGAYEPARLVLSDGITLRVSPLTLGTEPVAPGSVFVHADCSEAFAREGLEGWGESGG
jgi:hypothetical protein